MKIGNSKKRFMSEVMNLYMLEGHMIITTISGKQRLMINTDKQYLEVEPISLRVPNYFIFLI